MLDYNKFLIGYKLSYEIKIIISKMLSNYLLEGL